MYFLKCSKCGHFNEIKTEYQVFCCGCNKKIDNNYSDWKKRNPEKTFDEYKQLNCTTETQNKPLLKSKPKLFGVKGLKYWISFAVAFALFYAIGHFAGESIVSFFKKPIYDQAMMDVVSKLNKSCPIMIDNATRLDNAIALPDNVFQYNYTLVNMVKDSVNTDEMKKYLEPTIINFVKTNPEMKTLRDNNTTINYYYKDKTGIYLLTISVKPEQYQ